MITSQPAALSGLYQVYGSKHDQVDKKDEMFDNDIDSQYICDPLPQNQS